MKYFGTDGIRGTANEVVTPEIAYKIGRYIGNSEFDKKYIVIGKDSRISCDMLESSLVAGITSAGGDVLLLGVIPTPAVTYLTAKLGASFGLIISASHNPVTDNGIKVVDSRGVKISEKLETEIEKFIDGEDNVTRATAGRIGSVRVVEEALEMYVDKLVNSVKSDLRGLKVVIDCANGAASKYAPIIFSQFECETVFINNEPNGLNINENCGSTNLEGLIKSVVEHKADLGFALDGDADRVLFVDEYGNEADGDILVYILASKYIEEQKLKNSSVALTVMSNAGVIKTLQRNLNVDVITTSVGDKYVYEAIEKNDLVLGGETSGHIILRDFSQGGDGMLVALQILEYFATTTMKLNTIVKSVQKFPSILTNINVIDKEYALTHRSVVEEIKRVENILGDSGRVLVRASGTENKIRVLVECEDEAECKSFSSSISDVLRQFKEN